MYVWTLTADELAGRAVDVAGVPAAARALEREDVALGLRSLLPMSVVVAGHVGRGVYGDHVGVRRDGVLMVHRLGSHCRGEEGGDQGHGEPPDGRHPQFGCRAAG